MSVRSFVCVYFVICLLIFKVYEFLIYSHTNPVVDICVGHIFSWLMVCFFLKINLFILLFLAVLGFCCCTRAFSSCSEQGLLFLAVHGLLIAVASLVVEHGL